MKKRKKDKNFKEKGKNRNRIIVIIAIVLLILSFLFIAIKLTGQIIGQITKFTGDATSTPIYTCTDSDKGINYFEKGVCKDKRTEYTDVCYSSKGLAEYYCSKDQYSCIRQESSCPFGCLDGACMKILCSDSDNGRDYGVKGVVILNNVEHADYCFDDEYVVEYYCSGNSTYNSVKMSCDNGCVNGACFNPAEAIQPEPVQPYTQGDIEPEAGSSSVFIWFIVLAIIAIVAVFFFKEYKKKK